MLRLGGASWSSSISLLCIAAAPLAATTAPTGRWDLHGIHFAPLPFGPHFPPTAVCESRIDPLAALNQGPRKLKIFSGTWNVNGKPPSVPLEEWLLPRYGPEVADIYVLGLQVR